MAERKHTLDVRFPLMVWCVWIAATAVLFGLAQHWFGAVWPLEHTFQRWDGGWYETIANQGYTLGAAHKQTNVVFFPLYPVIVALVRRVVPASTLAAGVGVSLASFGGALVLFYDLVRRRYDASAARWATVLLAFNPFGLFFGLAYTESLFLLLSVAVFWLLARRMWWSAAVIASLAGATRPVGISLGLIVVAQWLWAHRQDPAGHRWQTVLTAAGLGIVSLGGLAAFMAFLQAYNHDSLAFAHVQRYWGRLGPPHLVSELRASWHQYLFNLRHHIWVLTRLNAFVVWYAATLAGVAGVWLLVRQREYWFALYVGLGVAVPLASGTVGSMDRYVMVLFPLYIAAARALNGWARRLVTSASIAMWAGFWLLYLGQRMFFG